MLSWIKDLETQLVYGTPESATTDENALDDAANQMVGSSASTLGVKTSTGKTTNNNTEYSLNLVLPGNGTTTTTDTTLTDDQKKKRMLYIMGGVLAAIIILIIALKMRK